MKILGLTEEKNNAAWFFLFFFQFIYLPLFSRPPRSCARYVFDSLLPDSDSLLLWTFCSIFITTSIVVSFSSAGPLCVVRRFSRYTRFNLSFSPFYVRFIININAYTNMNHRRLPPRSCVTYEPFVSYPYSFYTPRPFSSHPVQSSINQSP